MTDLLDARNVSVTYGDEHALRGVNLRVVAGEFIALIGPNGSGKTTLLRALCGTVALAGGSVSIGGHDLGREPVAAKAHVGFGVDPAALPKLLTGRECLSMFAGARGLSGIPSATLELADKLSMADRLDRRVISFSLGMRQKLGILLGLLGEPDVLLLDEPFNGLDPPSGLTLKLHLAALVANGRTSVLLATHALDIAERYASKTILLLGGRLQQSWDMAALRATPQKSLEQEMVAACR